MQHSVPAVGTYTLAAWTRGLGPAHAARTLSSAAAAAPSSSMTHESLLAHTVQLAFHVLQLLAQHVGFFL